MTPKAERDAFEAELVHASTRQYACKAAQIVPAEMLATIQSVYDSGGATLNAAVIVLQARGISIGRDSLTRHVKGQCACGRS